MIVALVLAAMLAAEPPPPDAPDTGARIAAAMAAEQSLQGPLDGGWTLRDSAGRPLYRFEFADPAGGQGPLSGAWRDMRGGTQGGEAGVITDLRRSGRSLRIEFAPLAGPAASVRVIEVSPGMWTGRIIAGGARRAVTLRRD
jgi:hypothetical protein